MPAARKSPSRFADLVEAFLWNGRSTVKTSTLGIDTYTNEFWTSKQRAANSLHEVSYRACFKPQLPAFFINSLTAQGDLVYDPFMGRGTTVIEAAVLGRLPCGNDVNPLSQALVRPRLAPPNVADVASRLSEIDWRTEQDDGNEDLLVFYHPVTLSQINALRSYLAARKAHGRLDDIDRWIRMVAINRLTGHSPGFFSVYTMPPNQAVSVEAQRKINRERRQTPGAKNVAAIILKKTRSLLRDVDDEIRTQLASTRSKATLLTGFASDSPALPDSSIDLVVTSPPFLDVVDYATDNWLRCWFCGIDPAKVRLSQHKRIEDWQSEIRRVLRELKRVLRKGGTVAFEVGEVRGGTILLEKFAVLAGIEAGLDPVLILVNDQQFTKTANCWGVSNRSKGTNTNRVVLFTKSN